MTIAQKLSFDVQLSDHARTAAEREQVMANPGFGQVFTDHMITIDYTEGAGWHDARLGAYGPLSLDPATAVFHYAQELFEGLKAYRQADGSIVTFRPYANAARFNTSCARMAMPALPEEMFVRSLELLVDTDRDCVPTQEGHSLYLRPFMIATQRGLGVNSPSSSFTFIVIASPSAAYFTGGVKPVSVWLSEDYTRAAPGGTGAAKCGGNYAAAFVAQAQAVREGCDQVVWLDASEHRWVEEIGNMNLFFVHADGRIVTPELSDSILAGVTRASVLDLAADLGHQVEERRISVDEWRDGLRGGDIVEVFASGTAAVITPIGRLAWDGGELPIGDHSVDHGVGPATAAIRRSLLDLQYGRTEDTRNWLTRLA